jgi:hypothetical protein
MNNEQYLPLFDEYQYLPLFDEYQYLPLFDEYQQLPLFDEYQYLPLFDEYQQLPTEQLPIEPLQSSTTQTETIISPSKKIPVCRKRKINEIDKNKKIRKNYWRIINSEKNEIMRGAVFLYRFYPMIRSCIIQKSFKLPVKTLMRYVYYSCKVEYKKFNLYFGKAGKSITGNYDRALNKTRINFYKNKNKFTISNKIPIPKYAKEFIERKHIYP